MAHDVIFAKDTVDSDRPELAMTQNARKRCCCTTFDLIGLLPTNHIIAYCYEQKIWMIYCLIAWDYTRALSSHVPV